MRRLRHVYALSALLLALLVACGGTTPAAPPTTTSPSTPTTAVAPSATSTPTTAVAPSATSAPSATPVPTAGPAASPTPESNAEPTAEPTSDSKSGPLEVDRSSPAFERGSLSRRPYVVMIDNHPNAYPQTGLDKAALVFEALAEFGITRFMAFYADNITPEVEMIGPVRSARIYYVYWAIPFHPVYSHAGGSPAALDYLSGSDELLNLDQLSYEGVYSWRSKERRAPHNLYTNTELMSEFRAKREGDSPLSVDAGYLFREPEPAPAAPAVPKLRYYFLQEDLPISWSYDGELNGYRRIQWGRSHVDAASGKQIWARSVVVMQVREETIEGDEKGRIEQQVIGSGPARLFAEGQVHEITWKKSTEDAELLFYDQQGQEVRFPSGHLWIAVVPDLSHLSY